MFAFLILSFVLIHPQTVDAFQDLNPLELSQEMRFFIDKKVDRNLDPMLRLQTLVAAVFQDADLNFTYSSGTRTAIETFNQRSGNCLSFTTLFIAMARYLNLDAKFREVEIAPTWYKTGAFVKLAQHVNAAVFIGGQAFGIDVFPGVNRIEIGGQVVADNRGVAHFFNNKGVDELGSGNIAAAEAYFQRALQQDPTTVSVWINLGAARVHDRKLAEAEKCYRQALELEPRNLAAMSNLANVYELTGRTKEAARLQIKVKQFREKNPYHHYNLGMQAFEAAQYEQAIAHFRKALKLKAGEHNFYFALSRAYGQLNNSEETMINLQLAEKYASDLSNKLRYAQKIELLKAGRDPVNQLHTGSCPQNPREEFAAALHTIS